MWILIALVLLFLLGLVVGAYSHKWLAKETGAPANLSVASAPAAVSVLVAHGVNAAHDAMDDATASAKATIAKV